MRSSCPKKALLASFYYLEHLRSSGIFNATPQNVDYITDKIRDIFRVHIDNQQKYNNASQYIKGDALHFDLITKSSLASVNYANTTQAQLPLTEKQHLQTDRNIELLNPTEYALPNNNYNYSTIYDLSLQQLEPHQIYLLGREDKVENDLINLFTTSLNKEALIEGAKTQERFSELFRSVKDDILFAMPNIEGFSKHAVTINSGTVKIYGTSIKESLLEVTPVSIKRLLHDNAAGVTFLNTAGYSNEEHQYLKETLCTEYQNILSRTLEEHLQNNTLSHISKSTRDALISEVLSAEKINTKATSLLLQYGDDNIEIDKIVKQTDEPELFLNLTTLSHTIAGMVAVRGKTKENREYVLASGDLHFYTINPNDPATLLTNNAIVESLHIRVLPASRLHMDINSIAGTIQPDPLTIQNENLSKSYFYGKELTKTFKNVCIDEADKGISGKNVNIYYAIASHAKNIIVGTGTATEGYASGIIGMLAYSGEFTPQSMAQNTEDFKTLFDKWQVKDLFIKEMIFAASVNQKISNEVRNTFQKFIANKKINRNFHAFKFAKDQGKILLELIAANLDQRMDIIEKLDLNQVSGTLSKLLDSAYKMSESKHAQLDLTAKPSQFLLRILFENRYFLKRYPGIANVTTYANQIGSFHDIVNTSIGTRSTILKRDETMIMHDLSLYNQLKVSLARGEINETFFRKHNDVGATLASRALKDYSRDHMIAQVKQFLVRNFEIMIDSLHSSKLHPDSRKNNQAVLTQEVVRYTGEETITYNDIVNAIGKSTTQSPDDAKTMYRQALSEDFSDAYFDRTLHLNQSNLSDEVRLKREQKLHIFHAIVSAYKEMFLNPQTLSGLENGKDSIVLQSASGEFSMEEAYMPTFTRFVDKKLETISPATIKFSETTIPVGMRFSKNIAFNKPQWGSFFTGALHHTYKHGNDKEEELMNLFGSKGLERIIDDEVNKGNNIILASSRIIGGISNTLDMIHSALHREDKSRPFVIVVNISDTNTRHLLSRIDTDVLDANNVTVHAVTRTMLDSTIKQYAKQDVQLSITSNYQAIARGLDLSMQDSIIAAGAFTDGRELTQFLSRLYSVDKTTAEIYMFNGGNDISVMSKKSLASLDRDVPSLLLGNFEEDRIVGEHFSDLSYMTSYSNKLNERGYEKLRMNQRFMSGDQVDIDYQAEQPFEISDNYKDIIDIGVQKKLEEEIYSEHAINRGEVRSAP